MISQPEAFLFIVQVKRSFYVDTILAQQLPYNLLSLVRPLKQIPCNVVGSDIWNELLVSRCHQSPSNTVFLFEESDFNKWI